MAEDWKEKLAKGFNRPLPEDKMQDKKNHTRIKNKGKPNHPQKKTGRQGVA